MIKLGGGRVININNVAAKQPGAESGPTSISRAAGLALTKMLSKEFAAQNVLVNTVTIGNSLPIVIGETGWKATQTNGNSLIELFTANQINQKWYLDLLNGWQAAGTGPVSIFYFEAFDEAWKGTDDGWGLWDASRTARYALCGTPAGDVCNNPVYDGAGYYP